MSAPAFLQSNFTGSQPSRPIPPYAGPSVAAGELTSVRKVGPFVPAESRTAEWVAAAVMTPPPVVPVESVTAPFAPASATPATHFATVATPAVASAAVEMSVPTSIPPYRPLRPTPIVTPAIRTPLYIPPIPTPTGESVVEDEGVIEPQLVHTAEFAIPELPVAEAPVAETPVAELPSVEDAAADALTDASTDTVSELHAAGTTSADVEAVSDSALPWIDAFLANTPAMPMEAVADDAASLEAEAMLRESIETAAEPIAQPIAETVAEPENVDEWPLDEAAAEFRALRSAMDEQVAPEASVAPEDGTTDISAVPPLPEWSDEDLMDIMPIRHSGKTPLSSAAIPADGELWAERARKAHEEAQVFRAMASAEAEHVETGTGEPSEAVSGREATAEEAAHALELLARRVRAGELMLPSYDPRMGEPAALVAALAALLGVKLR